MSKERLGEIKQIKEEASRHFRNADTFNFSFMLKKLYKDRHIDYLIEQAERVQELESENRILRTVAESNKFIGEQYLEQNKRYREAIERALGESGWGDEGNALYRTIGILSKALEGKSSE